MKFRIVSNGSLYKIQYKDWWNFSWQSLTRIYSSYPKAVSDLNNLYLQMGKSFNQVCVVLK